MIEIIGRFDTSRDYTLQFTITTLAALQHIWEHVS
jgi:hypothetical protein